MDDEMDYVMHHPQDNPLSPSQPQQHHHHQPQQQQQQQQQQLRQCPYWPDHQQLPGFPPHYGPGLHSPSNNHSPHHSHHNSQGSLNQGLAPLNNRSQASHPYDPVHSSIPTLNNNWYPGAPSYHWSPVTLPQPRPSLDTFYPYSTNPSGAGPVNSATPGNNSSSSRGVGSLDPTSTSGPVQPPVDQNQLTPRHEPFTPFPFHHQSASPHRFGAVPSPMSAPTQNQQSGQQPTSFTPSSSGFSGIRLPALSSPVLPRPSQTSSAQPQQEGAVTSNGNSTMPTDDLSPLDSVGHSGRATRTLPEPPRNRNLFDGSARNPEMAQAAGSTTDPDGASGARPPSATSSENRRRLLNMRARQASTRRSDSSEYDSEEDAAEADQERALELFEQLAGPGVPPLRGEDMSEARIRAHQLLRGQMSTKRVASRTALASLQSVDIDTLPESEKTCIICYNDFGVENPEGINEAPLRLPRCKHVFGDHCIKKWFEESDSCPYCRDKVPSEPQFKAGGQALREYLSRSTGMPLPRATLRALSMEQSNSASAFAMLRDATGDGSRYVRAPAAGADASPTRAWQTGERRSPPSEAQENRRRTRARHGSFRSSAAASSFTAAAGRSASYSMANPAASQHQQSPGRDRVNPPNLLPQGLPYAHDARRSLTSLMARQFPSGTFRPQSHYSLNPQDNIWQTNYQRHAMMAEPLGLNPPSASNQQSFENYMPPPVYGIPQHGHQEQSAGTGGAGLPAVHPPQPFPGPSGMMSPHYGSASDVFGYNPQGGNQNNQANNNRMEPFSFPNAQNNNQGNGIPNRESNW